MSLRPATFVGGLARTAVEYILTGSSFITGLTASSHISCFHDEPEN